MKKIYLILSLLFTIVYVNAQTNVQLHYDFGKVFPTLAIKYTL